MSDHRPSAAEALARLESGNAAFCADEIRPVDLSHDRRLALAREQRPIATLVGCSDSRVGPELLFGAGLGELFIVRNAGSIVGPHALGSIEYSVAVLGVPLVVVLGHERCGAVEAALDAVGGASMPSGAISTLVDAIGPVVRPFAGAGPEDADGALTEAIRANVRVTVAHLRGSEESIIREPRSDGRLWIVGAYYDLSTGHVDFFDRESDG